MIKEKHIIHFFILLIHSALIWCLAIFYFENKFNGQSDSCSAMTSASGTAHTKGDMRIVRVHVPPFYSTHSALTSWGVGFNKVQLI